MAQALAHCPLCHVFLAPHESCLHIGTQPLGQHAETDSITKPLGSHQGLTAERLTLPNASAATTRRASPFVQGSGPARFSPSHASELPRV